MSLRLGYEARVAFAAAISRAIRDLERKAADTFIHRERGMLLQCSDEYVDLVNSRYIRAIKELQSLLAECSGPSGAPTIVSDGIAPSDECLPLPETDQLRK